MYLVKLSTERGNAMTQKESTNIIIKLKKKGWTGDEITEFIAFIETHNPTEQEVMELVGENKDK